MITNISNDAIKYGYNFPLKARFKRDENVFYTIMDYDDGEDIDFFGLTDKPSSNAAGYALYQSTNKGIRLVNIKNIERI